MASVASRSKSDEAARLEAIAIGAGSALACIHQSAEEMHRALVAEYLERKHSRGLVARTLRFFSL
jgi:hypothetical protein